MIVADVFGVESFRNSGGDENGAGARFDSFRAVDDQVHDELLDLTGVGFDENAGVH